MNNTNASTHASPQAPVRHLVLMGVCGSGKTTVAGILADRTGYEVAEADDFHPRANVEKMASGVPLTDEDRWPWLEELRSWMDDRATAGKSAIVTCSALKRSYREVLRQCDAPVIFVHLHGPKEVLAARMAARTNHFMPAGLLDSQLETLEPLDPDEDGLVVDVGPAPQQIATEIMQALSMSAADPALANIGVYGLGVMGTSLARNLGRHGFKVALYNIDPAVTDQFMEHFGDEGDFLPTHSEAEFALALRPPRVAALMVTAGAATTAVTDNLAQLFSAGDVIIDMGNSLFTDTREREAKLRERGLHFVGCGTSGGEEGALLGPSLMVGGSAHAWEQLQPMFTAIAAKAGDGKPCCAHVGTDGAGHFVKMVHNGIEYADMQLIGEAYALLRSLGLPVPEIADIFRQWNQGELGSYLVEITAEILSHTDAKTGQPFIDVIADGAGQKGTGAWTVLQAVQLAVPATAIADATFARMVSSAERQRDTTQAALGAVGPVAGEARVDLLEVVEQVRQALYAAKIVAYTQGLALIQAGADEYGWEVDLRQVAQIWRAGCIIRADFLDQVASAYQHDPQLASLAVAPSFAKVLTDYEPAWRAVAKLAVERCVPVPALSSTLHYLTALRTPVLPTAMVQAQRDFFGAHTYRRRDQDGVFHTRWAQPERPEDEV